MNAAEEDGLWRAIGRAEAQVEDLHEQVMKLQASARRWRRLGVFILILALMSAWLAPPPQASGSTAVECFARKLAPDRDRI